jgi:hypothetical protein
MIKQCTMNPFGIALTTVTPAQPQHGLANYNSIISALTVVVSFGRGPRGGSEIGNAGSTDDLLRKPPYGHTWLAPAAPGMSYGPNFLILPPMI